MSVASFVDRVLDSVPYFDPRLTSLRKSSTADESSNLKCASELDPALQAQLFEEGQGADVTFSVRFVSNGFYSEITVSSICFFRESQLSK